MARVDIVALREGRAVGRVGRFNLGCFIVASVRGLDHGGGFIDAARPVVRGLALVGAEGPSA